MGAAALLLLAALAAPPAGAEQDVSRRHAERGAPSGVRWVLAATEDGVRVGVPVVDADPNRGVTLGVMPVWVKLSSGSLRRITAPLVTYNRTVGVGAGCDFYLYPSSGSSLELYGSIAQRSDRELYAEWNSAPFGARAMSWDGHAQVVRDASRRFFGVGPRAPQDAETDFTLASVNYVAGVIIPVAPGSHWALRVKNIFQAVRILPGPRRDLPDVEDKHPGATDSRRRLVDDALRLGLIYDTLDSPNTASRGLYAKAFLDAARDGWVSDMSYRRWGGIFKAYLPIAGAPGREPHAILAFQAHAEELNGNVPFWVLPSLGGKYSFRAYGDGRFVDHFMSVAQSELRLRVYGADYDGTPVSLWADPFIGAGLVAPSAGRAELGTVRPLYGIALRAVVRPQVVGSLDVGIGQEGPKVFVDLNYAF